jgi:hypothetical protein
VELPALSRQTRTNSDGAFSFGYGDVAEQTLPSGAFNLVVNAGLKDMRFGSYMTTINIQSGARNSVDSIQLPLLNKDIPFSYLASGTLNVVNGGEVQLDAGSADFLFPDNREQGAAHIQFLPGNSLKARVFDSRYTPLWVYGVQPVHIRVSGNLQVEFALPKFQGGYDYAPAEGELVVLIGMHADGNRLVPVGIGEAIAGYRIRSLGETQFELLDVIGYARVIPEQWVDLRAYRDGAINLQTLTLKLQTYQFVPPANEAEAAQRAQQLIEGQ